MTWLTMSPASKENWQFGQFAAQGRAQPLPQRFSSWDFGFDGYLNDRFLRPAGEQVDQIHGIAGGHHAHEVAGDRDVVRADFAADHVQRAKHDPLGFLDSRSRGSTEPEPQHGRVGVGKDLRPHARQQDIHAVPTEVTR